MKIEKVLTTKKEVSMSDICKICGEKGNPKGVVGICSECMPMTVSEFVKQITKEMEENNWQNKPILFNTSDRSNMHWLSVYESEGIVHMDVGDDGE